jgi:hypothetical protein
MIELIIIVPYRDREQHKFYFMRHMEYILEDYNYQIIFVHQKDNRPFNRGAMKNIGFLYAKEKYYNYKDITFVFHDIDTLPFDKILDYITIPYVVRHFYGFEHSLGGIFSILGHDFEKTLGFPTLWGWGQEDTIMQKRCLDANLQIDRNQFYKIGSPEILHLFDGIQRVINPGEIKYLAKNVEKLNSTSIENICYSIDKDSLNLIDNIFVINNSKIMYINVTWFNTINKITDNFYSYDIRQPISKIHSPEKNKKINTNKSFEWNEIPYYPSLNQKKYISIFSSEYATINKIKPKSTTSANIGLGGIIRK